MATFRFAHYIDIHWNGYDIVGDAGTVFSIPDQLYEEFEGDLRPVEPTLEWIDTNEFQTLKDGVTNYTVIATAPISVASTTSSKTWSLIDGGVTSAKLSDSSVTSAKIVDGSVSSAKLANDSVTSAKIVDGSVTSSKIADLAVNQAKVNSGAASSGYVLTANGSSGAIWAAQTGASGSITGIVGASPISATVVGGNATVSLNANYQTAGTYVTSVIGSSPVSATGTTAITVSIDQTAISAAAATAALNLRTLVRNATASTIAKGSVVYLASSNGTIPTIEKALATSDATSARTFGLVEADIASNSNGYVLNQGLFDPINTFGIADGAVLWLSATVAGGYSTVKPTGPNHGVLVGICVKGTSVGAGSIYVFIKNGAELDEIHDVNITSVLDGNLLIYSSAQSVWINKSISDAGIAASTHTHAYQPAGTYVTSVTGSAPLSASTTTAGVVTVSLTANYQTAGSYQPAGTYVTSVAGDSTISSSGTTAISLAHATTDGYHHVPATSTTNDGKFLKSGATAGSEAWAAIQQSDVSSLTTDLAGKAASVHTHATSSVNSGNYVASLVAGTGVNLANNSGNAATPTISIGQGVGTAANVQFAAVSAVTSSTDKTVITGSNTQATAPTAGSNAIQTFVTTDSFNRFKLEADGKHSWGPGSATVDTVLYRNTIGVLKTDTDLVAAGSLTSLDWSNTAASGSINSSGTFNGANAYLTGTNGFRHDTPATTSGTGQIAGMAMWVLVSGTNYQIRRSTGTSWARFKDNIEPTTISPEQFAALNFVQFDWNRNALLAQYPDLDSVDEKKQHGLLLDQLVDVLPEAVQAPTNSTDTETVNWHAVYLAAMVALQDAIKRIDELEDRVKTLENK